MKILKILSLSLFSFFILLSSLAYSGTTLSYNRNEAKNYASDHCKNYNTQDENNTKDIAYVSYKDQGTDCANFVSQSMTKGTLNFSCVKNANEIGTGKENKGEKGEITVSQLESQLTENFCFEIITDPSKAQAADIISNNDRSHVVISFYSGEQGKNRFGL